MSLTMQAFSEEERRQWLEALGGREAVSIIGRGALLQILQSCLVYISGLFLVYSI